MKLAPEHEKLLCSVLRKRTHAELRQVFALVRETNDRTLLNALAPPRKAAKRHGDPLTRELEQILKPILGPAREKAEMLVEHMAKSHRRKLGIEPKGLGDAAKRLRAHFSDEDIRVGAKKLMARLAKLYGGRETVV